jgi:hypothetical protein
MPRSHREVEITISFRTHDAAGICAFVTCITRHRSGQLAVDASRHITAHDALTLLDRVSDTVRELELEHFLTYCEPF